MEPSRRVPLPPLTKHISVLSGMTTPRSLGSHSPSPPSASPYIGSANYTDSEWREVQGWGRVVETNEIHKGYDQNGRKCINKYEIIKEIGRGVHGKVKLATTLDTNEMVAIKILPKKTRARIGRPESSQHEKLIRREIAILKKCVHPHVVRLREVINDPASEKIYLVLEYMWGGEVVWRKDDDEPALTLNQARSTFRDTVLGLEFLHYQGIIHRDIKPANLLWTKNHSVKISDFGVSHISSALDSSNALDLAKTAGTPAFFAPELCWTAGGERPGISNAIDVWALGVTLFCLLCGRVPFDASGEYELFEKILSDEVQYPVSVDPLGKDLLQKMLVKDPKQRIKLHDVKRHAFVTKDVPDPETWISETDPSLFGVLEVSEAEVHEAVSSFERFKRRLGKLGSRLAGGLRRRTTLSDTKPQSLGTKPSVDSFSETKRHFLSMMSTTSTTRSEDMLHTLVKPIAVRKTSAGDSDCPKSSMAPVREFRSFSSHSGSPSRPTPRPHSGSQSQPHSYSHLPQIRASSCQPHLRMSRSRAVSDLSAVTRSRSRSGGEDSDALHERQRLTAVPVMGNLARDRIPERQGVYDHYGTNEEEDDEDENEDRDEKDDEGFFVDFGKNRHKRESHTHAHTHMLGGDDDENHDIPLTTDMYTGGNNKCTDEDCGSVIHGSGASFIE